MMNAGNAAAALLLDIEYGEQQREQHRLHNARRAIIRRESNPLEHMPDSEFVNKYRVSKDFVRWLCGQVGPYLAVNNTAPTISIVLQVLCTLRFLAVGSYQTSIGESMYLAMSQPLVSRIISNVTKAIEQLQHNLIKFPVTEPERREESDRFERMTHFPGVIGCIDGTHIRIAAPAEEPWSFLNHKRYYSLNVQATCGADMRITSLEIFAGSAHDTRIWRESEVKREMLQVNREGFGPYFLLGDQGYPLERCMMIPYAAPARGSSEEVFNMRHLHTRSIIERVFGMLKGKWRCLHRERTMHYKPEKVARFLKCCVILHNALIMRRDPYYAEDGADPDNQNFNIEQIDDENIGLRELDRGRAFRNYITQTYCNLNQL